MPINWNFIKYEDAPEHYEPDWLIEGMIQADGLNIIAGVPKAYKSMLRRYLHACMIARSPAFGILPVPKRPVKMLQLLAEDHPGSERFIMDTILREMGYFGEIPITFAEPDHFLLDKPKHMLEFGKMLEGEGFDYFAIDPMFEYHSVEENSSSEMRKVTRSLHKLKKIATPLVIHHSGKTPLEGQRRSVVDSLRGSSALPGAANALIELTRRGGVRHEIRRRMKAADDADDWSVTLNPDTWIWLMDEPFTRDRVLAIVCENPGWTCKEIATHMSRGVASVQSKLKQLLDLKLVRAEKDGRKKVYFAL